MISECCGAEDRDQWFGGPWALGICPECRMKCVFITEEEFGEKYAKSQEIDALTGDER